VIAPRRTAGRLPAPAYLVLLLASVWVAAAPAAAQQATPSRFAIDTVAAIDQAVDDAGDTSTGIVLDAVVTVGLTRNLEAMVRPVAQRLATGEWNHQIWVAALRWERAGDIAIRIDGGLIPSPVGAANLLLRPHLNPTIALPSSLFTRVPLDPRTPRPTMLGAIYPLGVNVTVAGRHWDARAAVIETSPMRPRRIFYRDGINPPRFTTVVAGGGVTPFAGFRVGASVTKGGWLKAGESPGVTDDGKATLVTVESEFSARHTRLSAEWARDWADALDGDTRISGWFVQAQQTLTPRWFVAGRFERIDAPPTLALLPAPTDLAGVEEIVGYRLTPEITLRAGHRARRLFGRPDYSHQAQVSVVWWRRWL
jgi:hypothetical protein